MAQPPPIAIAAISRSFSSGLCLREAAELVQTVGPLEGRVSDNDTVGGLEDLLCFVVAVEIE